MTAFDGTVQGNVYRVKLEKSKQRYSGTGCRTCWVYSCETFCIRITRTRYNSQLWGYDVEINDHSIILGFISDQPKFDTVEEAYFAAVDKLKAYMDKIQDEFLKHRIGDAD